MNKLESDIYKLVQDVKIIRSADDYSSSYLKHGSVCDSGEGADRRFSWIKIALGSLEVKELVLKKAAEMSYIHLKREIKEMKKAIDNCDIESALRED